MIIEFYRAFLPEEKRANLVKFSEFSYLVRRNDRFYIIFAVMDGLYCFYGFYKLQRR